MVFTLTVTEGPSKGRVFSFDGHDNFFVGRSKEAHFRPAEDDKNISRLHCLIEINPPQCQLLDLESSNGTYLNGRKVSTAALKDGDLIQVGKTMLRVAIQDAALAETVAPALPPLPPPPAVPVARIVVPMRAKAAAGPRPGGKPGQSCVACAGDLPAEKVSPRDLPNPLLAYLCAACREQARTLPQPIAGYLVVKELGRGGMGVVYLAMRQSNGALLAVKTILPAAAGNATAVDRFFREAGILGELDHPHIVGYREMGEVNGLLYFAMDYVRGTDAGRLLKQEGPLPIARAVGLVGQLLDALDYAHGKGFVHRDIKPSNLLLEAVSGQQSAVSGGPLLLNADRCPLTAFRVKLADFGLARTYQASQLSGLTTAGAVAGTFEFMPPEQITHLREAKPPADQYAAAATLYTLLTYRIIHDLPANPYQRLLTILEKPPVPILARRADIPAELAALIHRALAREPAERFPDVQTMRLALAKFGP